MDNRVELRKGGSPETGALYSCSRCGETKGPGEFKWYVRRNRQGRTTLCHPCRLEYNREGDCRRRSQETPEQRATRLAARREGRIYPSTRKPCSICGGNGPFVTPHRKRCISCEESPGPCSRCGETKPAEEFFWAIGTSKGLRQTWCWSCRREYVKAEQKRDPRKRKVRNREAHQKRRARKRAAPSTLTFQEWEWIRDVYGGLCHYCRIRPGDTLDHWVPLAKGGSHSLENVVPCCLSCNTRKYTRSPAEFMESAWLRSGSPRGWEAPLG